MNDLEEARTNKFFHLVDSRRAIADREKEIGLARGEGNTAAVPFVKFPVARENKDHGSPTWESFVIS